MKRNVQLVQVNYRYGQNVFLPYSVAMIQAYCLGQRDLSDAYSFSQPLFLRDPIDTVVENMEQPDVLGLSCYIWNWEYCKALAQAVRAKWPSTLIVMGGTQVPRYEPDFFRQHPYVDAAVPHEGELVFSAILRERLKDQPNLMDVPGLMLNLDGAIHLTPPASRVNDLEQLPSPYLSGVFDEMIGKYGFEFQACQETHRGCPYSCLSGDTPVNTVEGMIPISELEGRTNIGVFTYDREAHKAIVSTASVVRKTGVNKQLVRVTFDDGTHIDCTPDHRFLVFTDKHSEWEVEANHLKAKSRVRAIKEYLNGSSRHYVCVSWTRRGRELKHRMIAAWMIGRPLAFGEEVHHIDKNPHNNLPGNLKICQSKQEHVALHPEVADRMTSNNPASNGLSEEWREKIGSSNRGKVRSEESRARYRAAALKREASKTADERSKQALKSADTKRALGIPMGNTLRDQATGQFTGNHKIVSVEPLPGLHDVYCLEVPETHWFYANNVLVSNCTFCDWGSATMSKVRRFGHDRLTSEFEWMGRHGIELLYNCDANYGLFQDDVALTEKLVETKQRYGAPSKFRAAYAKNSNERVYDISKKLNDEGMCKGVTLSFQSMDESTLDLIKRKNMKSNDFKSLITLYRRAGIPTYTELILGLPGETYDTFCDGITTLLEAGQHDSLNIYHAMLLPNSEMNVPAYRELHGIRGTRTPLLLLHGTMEPGDIQESYDIVTATNTMSADDWVMASLFGYVVQAFHCLNISQVVAVGLRHHEGMSYRAFYEGLIEWVDDHPDTELNKLFNRILNMLLGVLDGTATFDLGDRSFGDIMWPVEELLFLWVVSSKDRKAVLEMGDYVKAITTSKVADDLLGLQWNTTKFPDEKYASETYLSANWCKALESWLVNEPAELEHDRIIITVPPTGLKRKEFAKQIVWYGRKGGSMSKLWQYNKTGMYAWMSDSSDSES